MSAIFYRFKSQRTDSRLPIDGTGISVFDLKKEIILINNMGDGKEFDLGLYEVGTEEEYKDDNYILPRSTSVIVRRLPPARPGKGTAAIYVAGTNAEEARAAREANSGRAGRGGFGGGRGGFNNINKQKRFDGREDGIMPSAPIPSISAGPSVGGDDEAAKIAMMFQHEAEQWQATQEDMSNATPVYSSGRGGYAGRGGRGGGNHMSSRQMSEPDKPLPPGYICYRCGQRGHWIQNCPTNDDKEFDNRPRFKRTTGIPRSFLKTVEGPVASEGAAPNGVMITPEGGFVVAQPDLATWEKQRAAKPKIVTEADVREDVPSDPTLSCPICTKLFIQAVKTPCCSTTYCEECIQAHLLEQDFKCASCAERVGSLDRLEDDLEARERVREYIEKEIERLKFEDLKEEEQGITGTATPSLADASKPNPNGQSQTTDKPPPTQPQQTQNTQLSFEDRVPDPEVLQSQLAQVRMMQRSPYLPPQTRTKLEVTLQNLTEQLHMAWAWHSGMMGMNGMQNLAMSMWGGDPSGEEAGFSNHGDLAGLPSGPGPKFSTGSLPDSDRLFANARRRRVKRPLNGDTASSEPANKKIHVSGS